MDRMLVAMELTKLARELVGIRGIKFTRDFYVPKDVKPYVVPGTDVEVYSYEKNGVPFAAVFVGKQSKPLWHYRFRNEADRQRAIDEAVKSRQSRAEHMQKRKEERRQYRHDLQVGDILYSSWGYDQTNIDFYQVVEVGEKTVKIRQIGQKVVSSGGPSGDKVVAAKGHFTGPAMTKVVGTGGSVKVHSFAWASKWDGRPLYQTDPSFGH